MMNAAGYDVVTLGNHEFDYGYAQLKENMSKAKFKVSARTSSMRTAPPSSMRATPTPPNPV